MNRETAAEKVHCLWRNPPQNMDAALAELFSHLPNRQNRPIRVLFRADDIGVPGKQAAELFSIFRRHGIPLCLAVVPAWLTPSRWKALDRLCRVAHPIWCWHQHGWRHANHETAGRKQEFGPARSPEAIHRELKQGMERLQAIMGPEIFFPAFTPPWNRCGAAALTQLSRLGYRALSRTPGADPPAPADLPDFPVNIDLHTRKEPTPAAAWKAMARELTDRAAAGYMGLMIHHQRMNAAAFAFLDTLLSRLSGDQRFRCETLRSLADAGTG